MQRSIPSQRAAHSELAARRVVDETLARANIQEHDVCSAARLGVPSCPGTYPHCGICRRGPCLHPRPEPAVAWFESPCGPAPRIRIGAPTLKLYVAIQRLDVSPPLELTPPGGLS